MEENRPKFKMKTVFYSFAVLLIFFAFGMPVSGYEWTSLPDMTYSHKAGTMTVMRNGRVLLIGGAAGDTDNTHALAEIFDPVSKTFRATGSMHQKRNGHCSVALENGNVLVAGGSGGRMIPELKSVELYNARTGRFSVIGNMSVNRMASPACTLLLDGNVVLTGGVYEGTMGSGNTIVDRFDSKRSTLALRVGELNAPRSGSGHAAILLNTGNILNTGGMSDYQSFASPAAELYDPVQNRSSALSIQPTGGPGHYAAAALPDGKVILMKKGDVTYPEYYDPACWQFETVLGAGAFKMNPAKSAIVPLRSGKILFFTGQQLRLFDPAGNSTELIDLPQQIRDGRCIELNNGQLFCADLEKKSAALLTLGE
ncbi:hypothetical protein SAMN04489760_11220 [Syntrophus gentianae]|uniref:Kelch motif-containing protein n=2 Tax=Syntrophus gentianae TaxID=43775 RepID=A0A1H7XST6_9BACT|nr:hypothetical protein SAMN04489760_11220 [Syntrophus gentianae]